MTAAAETATDKDLSRRTLTIVSNAPAFDMACENAVKQATELSDERLLLIEFSDLKIKPTGEDKTEYHYRFNYQETRNAVSS